MVEYWHWHSIHNSLETYWKGLLSHDFKENDTYRSAKVIGKEFAELGSHLVNLKKHNKVGFLVSNGLVPDRRNRGRWRRMQIQ